MNNNNLMNVYIALNVVCGVMFYFMKRSKHELRWIHFAIWVMFFIVVGYCLITQTDI